MDETKKLAKYACELSYENLPIEVINKAKDLILDQWGVELACSTRSWSRLVYRYITDLRGKTESTIINYGDKVPSEHAAFVNATFGHGFEFDDNHRHSTSHPGSVVIPAAFAMGERELIDGKSFILAVVTGYEVMGNIGKAVSPSIVHRGHHPTSSLGPFGAAAAASKVLGFSQDEMVNALGIAGSYCSGLSEFMITGGDVKRIHAAIGAQSGVRAALLASQGLTAPPTILEGERGFCNTFADECHPDDITAGLGKHWVVIETNYKRYCCCYSIHSPIDAVSKIISDHKIIPANVEEVIVGLSRASCGAVGSSRQPKTVTEAQFNAPFSLAMTLIKRSNNFKDYNEETIENPEILSLSKKIRAIIDEEVDAEFPEKMAARVTIRMKDGARYQEKVDFARGTPENPMTREELEAKFLSTATAIMPRQKAMEIINTINALETMGNISELARLLTR